MSQAKPKPKKETSGPIETDVTVSQIKTMADGGIRVSFDLPEKSVMQAAQFMECKRIGAVLKLTAVVLPGLTNGEKQTHSRTARSPLGMAGG